MQYVSLKDLSLSLEINMSAFFLTYFFTAILNWVGECTACLWDTFSEKEAM